MATKEFVAVNFTPGQLLDEDVMDQLNNNMVYLRDQSVDGLYQHRLGGVTDVGLKILSGTATVPARKAQGANATISFAKLFAPNSRPNVVATVVSYKIRQVNITIQGITGALPDNRGFIAKVTVPGVGTKPGVLNNPVYVSWAAIGY